MLCSYSSGSKLSKLANKNKGYEKKYYTDVLNVVYQPGVLLLTLNICGIKRINVSMYQSRVNIYNFKQVFTTGGFHTTLNW